MACSIFETTTGFETSGPRYLKPVTLISGWGIAIADLTLWVLSVTVSFSFF